MAHLVRLRSQLFPLVQKTQREINEEADAKRDLRDLLALCHWPRRTLQQASESPSPFVGKGSATRHQWFIATLTFGRECLEWMGGCQTD
ncbi:hypothetical protein BaRGS_00021788 [Batillaria attramentaria]|uniref:Uncharacterized protein n=1 Tax=Batillaria attramentaria TaxID=370345 RepID=A0ABD0KJ73_9CAEN